MVIPSTRQTDLPKGGVRHNMSLLTLEGNTTSGGCYGASEFAPLSNQPHDSSECHLALSSSSACRLQRFLKLLPPSEVNSHERKYGRWIHISAPLPQRRRTGGGGDMTWRVQGLARELMPCHKEVLNAPSEGDTWCRTFLFKIFILLQELLFKKKKSELQL